MTLQLKSDTGFAKRNPKILLLLYGKHLKEVEMRVSHTSSPHADYSQRWGTPRVVWGSNLLWQ